MDGSDCPIHVAALLSRRRTSVEPLLTRVTRRSRTEECRSCLLCRKAIECITEPTADSWAELWHSSFRAVGEPADPTVEKPRPLLVDCPDCGARISTGLRIRAGPDAFHGNYSLRCPGCTKIVSFRAADAYS
jgi:hypothetical protein